MPSTRSSRAPASTSQPSLDAIGAVDRAVRATGVARPIIRLLHRVLGLLLGARRYARLPAGLDRKLAVELWLYPDGSRIAELSTKCAPADWLETTTQSRDLMKAAGVSLSGEQATKTRVALEYFAALRD